jgi:hypothetical protein
VRLECADARRQHEALLAITRRTGWMMQALRAARDLGLASWCIGAGAVRNMVWDDLHGHARPSALADIDLAYFDARCLDGQRDAELQRQLEQALPGLPWEVTNQAGVHLWFESYFGHAVDALPSLEAAVASWPEYATSVGLSLDGDDRLTVIAPHGLDDLFGMIVRRNPARVSIDEYRRRVRSKAYTQRWPRVSVVLS